MDLQSIEFKESSITLAILFSNFLVSSFTAVITYFPWLLRTYAENVKYPKHFSLKKPQITLQFTLYTLLRFKLGFSLEKEEIKFPMKVNTLNYYFNISILQNEKYEMYSTPDIRSSK